MQAGDPLRAGAEGRKQDEAEEFIAIEKGPGRGPQAFLARYAYGPLNFPRTPHGERQLLPNRVEGAGDLILNRLGGVSGNLAAQRPDLARLVGEHIELVANEG